MLNISDKTKCCGCCACLNICPKSAIEMKEDEFGFKYPVIDKAKCINCGLCDKVCPVLKNEKSAKMPQAYACINKDESIRLQSSSGGVFSIIANYILENGGVVFGAAFDENFDVKHIYIDSKDDLYRLRTSKYVQSYIGDTYRQAKEFLENGRMVLFTGTPCQIEGLKSYLKKDYEKLFTQDLICHGVPSPKVWRKYKEYRKKIDKKEPKEINFRSKRNGWNSFSLEFIYSEKKRYSKIKEEDIFMRAFLTDLSLRDSCYSCVFKKESRVSDITLADFWGVKDIIPELYSKYGGVSLTIVHSDKGRLILDIIKDGCIVRQLDENEFRKAIDHNKNFLNSAKGNTNREKFFENLDNEDFNKLVSKYVPYNIIKMTKMKMKNFIKKGIRSIKK